MNIDITSATNTSSLLEKPPQVGCLQTEQCDDLEEAVNSLSNLEYEQAKHCIQVVSMVMVLFEQLDN